MASLSRITCHAVHAMAPAAREALARELFAVHAQIFRGLGYEEFRDYVVERPSQRTWIYVKRNTTGAMVGYMAIHAFTMPLQSRMSTVIRLEAGTLRAARGHDLTMVWGLIRLLRVWLAAPWRPFCIFAALTHPSSYTFLAHYAPAIWPHVDAPRIPDTVQRQMEELADAFALERVDPADPSVRRVNWITIESEEELEHWRTSRRPDTRFYIRANPGYVNGDGLVTFIPVTATNILRAMTRFITSRAGKLARIAFGGSPPEVSQPEGPPARRPRPPARDGEQTPPDFQPSHY